MLLLPDDDLQIFCRRSTVTCCNRAAFGVQAPSFRRTNPAQPRSVPKLDQRRMLSVGRSLKRPGAIPPDSMGG